MTILYLILPLALVFATGAVAAFAWTVRSGQLDDVDTPPRRILFEDAASASEPLTQPAALPGPTSGPGVPSVAPGAPPVTPASTPVDAAPPTPAGAAALAPEAQLRDLENQVRRTQKLESLGLLAGGVAHDFNNILAVIGSNVGLLEESTSGEETAEIITEVQRAVARGAALTHQLLAFSRKQMTRPLVLDLNGAIADTRKMLRRMVGEDVEILTSLDPEAARVCIDPGHLVQVLMNLSVNARDAMPGGGTLTISTRKVCAKLGVEAELSIADTGCGMTDEVRRRAFEPLFTTKGLGQGTGLGLSVVHGIVEKAGGRITIESEVGHGTTFHIFLPTIDAPSDVLGDAHATTTAHGSETILFVDDDLYVRESASRALRSRGYTVVEAGNGTAALELLRARSAPIDLLVTDVVMPGMNGRELAEAARDERPSLRVLYTSGYTDDAALQSGIRYTEVAYLEKPYDVHGLADKVREVLDVA